MTCTSMQRVHAAYCRSAPRAVEPICSSQRRGGARCAPCNDIQIAMSMGALQSLLELNEGLMHIICKMA